MDMKKVRKKKINKEIKNEKYGEKENEIKR